MTPTVALDLDGVLVDFTGAACLAHNRPNPYEIEGATDYHMERIWGITQEEFWRPLRGFDFWANLPWISDGREILRIVEERFGRENIILLSKPYSSPESASGKVEWILNNLPQYADQYLLGSAKDFCSHPGAILIDDYDYNIEMWAARGGTGILVPRPWNAMREQKAVAYLKEVLFTVPNLTQAEAPKVQIRKFETGAIRDTDHNKFDFEGFLSPLVIEEFGKYMHKHQLLTTGDLRPSDNWQQGIPRSQYMKSLIRHVFAAWHTHRYNEGENIIDSLCATIFNAQGYLFELLAEGKENIRPKNTGLSPRS